MNAYLNLQVNSSAYPIMPNAAVWSDDFISVNLSSDSNSTFPEISTASDNDAPSQNSCSMKLLFLLLLLLPIGLILLLMARRYLNNFQFFSSYHHLEVADNNDTTTSHREINFTSPPDETQEKPINVEQPKTHNLTPLKSAAQEPQKAGITLSTVPHSLIPHNSHNQPAKFENSGRENKP